MGGIPAVKTDNNVHGDVHKTNMMMPKAQPLVQPPPPQVLVIERMHSGKFICY